MVSTRGSSKFKAGETPRRSIVDINQSTSMDDEIEIDLDDDNGSGRQDISPSGTSASGVGHAKRQETSTFGHLVDATTLDSIVDIFAKSKAPSKKSGVSWKPETCLPKRTDTGLDSCLPIHKHGNSYKILQSASKSRLESKKDASKKWFELPTQEITEEVKADLRVLRLRSAFDPKQFYKKFDETKFPTEFHVGTVVENAADFYSGRLSKKQRKRTMAEEVMHDEYLASVRKKRFNRIQDDATYWSRRSGSKGRKTSNPRIKKKPARKRH
jgi:hypothetical protein